MSTLSSEATLVHHGVTLPHFFALVPMTGCHHFINS